MEKVRRQHYVPRMYLKRFGYGNIGDEYISVLKLQITLKRNASSATAELLFHF